MLELLWRMFAVLLVLASAAGSAQAQRPPGDYRELERLVLRELKETNTPGAAVGIVSGGRVVYAKGFGVSSVETGAPVTPDMLFRIGSVTKMLTAAVFVSLAEEKGIALDAPVGNAVRRLGPRLSSVTPRQLLSHSAGVIDYARVCCAQEESAAGPSSCTVSWGRPGGYSPRGSFYWPSRRTGHITREYRVLSAHERKTHRGAERTIERRYKRCRISPN